MLRNRPDLQRMGAAAEASTSTRCFFWTEISHFIDRRVTSDKTFLKEAARDEQGGNLQRSREIEEPRVHCFGA